jgi:hypothetical protein
MRTFIATLAIGLGIAAPADAAQATPNPVRSAEVFAAAHRISDQAVAGVEELTRGAAEIDRSRTSFGNYLRYSNRRQGASFALFGTIPVNGVARPFWCVGNVEVVRTGSGRTRVAWTLSCPGS